MSSGGMCTCLMSSGHTLYPLGNTVFPWEAVALNPWIAALRHGLLSACCQPSTWAWWRFFPLLHSHGLPPRKLTSYFNDLHPKIKEIYISALNLKWLLKFKNISDIEPSNLAFWRVWADCPWKHRAWLALAAERRAVCPPSGAIACARLLVLTFSLHPPRHRRWVNPLNSEVGMSPKSLKNPYGSWLAHITSTPTSQINFCLKYLRGSCGGGGGG